MRGYTHTNHRRISIYRLIYYYKTQNLVAVQMIIFHYVIEFVLVAYRFEPQSTTHSISSRLLHENQILRADRLSDSPQQPIRSRTF